MLTLCFSPLAFASIALLALSGGALAGYIIGAIFAVGGRT
jgi:hypothetical protein